MLKKLIAPVVVSGALLASLAVGGAAYAGTQSTTAPATAPAGHHHGGGMLRAWMKAHRADIRAEALAVSARTIGITSQDLRTELKAGASIAQVATAHGVSVTTVVEALTTAADAKVTGAATAGTLTPTQGARITSRIPARITKIVNDVF